MLTEGNYPFEALLSEANGARSREVVTIVAGQTLLAGHVIGKITASGKYKEWNEANSDGSQTAAGVLAADCDASAADAEALIIARDAEVKADLLVYHAGADAGDKAAAAANLATLGIVVRAGVVTQ